jgi:hypothetical protein
MEPQSLGPRAARLADLFRQQREIPLNLLEAGFSSFNQTQAGIAYDESLAAVEFIESRHGRNEVLKIVERIGQGESTETSLRQVLHDDYGQFEDELRAYLTTGRD